MASRTNTKHDHGQDSGTFLTFIERVSRIRHFLMVVLVALCYSEAAWCETVVTFSDANLEKAVRLAISKPAGAILVEDLVGTGFTTLTATRTHIREISGLEYCTDLTELNLSFNGIRDVRPLASLSALTHLHLHFNQIEDIQALASLKNLKLLYLQSNRIQDLAPLSGLSQLRELTLPKNQIGEIDALKGLTGLNKLYLDNNEVTRLTALADMHSLTELSFSNNGVSDISVLRNMTGLAVVRGTLNNVRDISPLANLQALHTLEMASNKISDIQILTGLRGMGEGAKVDLRLNPLNQEGLCTHAGTLAAKGVTIEAMGSCGDDVDGDGLSADYEAHIGTEPEMSDSDQDGLSDGEEVQGVGTDPLNPDSDGDEMPDGWEVQHGLNPIAQDADDDLDEDTFSNKLEFSLQTDPNDRLSVPQPPDLKLSVNSLSVDAIERLGYFAVENAGDLPLHWTVKIEGDGLRVTEPPVPHIPPMVPLFNEAYENVNAGTGPRPLTVVIDEVRYSRTVKVTFTNDENPLDREVLVVSIEGTERNDPQEGLLLIVAIAPEEGGQVFQNPSGNRYLPGTAVSIGAVANTGWIFDRWQGQVDDPNAASTSTTVTEDTTLIAFFVEEQGGLGCAAVARTRPETFDVGAIVVLILMAFGLVILK
jgi:hypothetical protein